MLFRSEGPTKPTAASEEAAQAHMDSIAELLGMCRTAAGTYVTEYSDEPEISAPGDDE